MPMGKYVRKHYMKNSKQHSYDAIRALFKDGWTKARICEALKVSRATINRALLECQHPNKVKFGFAEAYSIECRDCGKRLETGND